MNYDKVNDVGAKIKTPKLYDSNIEEVVKYIDRDLESFQANDQGSSQDTWNSR